MTPTPRHWIASIQHCLFAMLAFFCITTPAHSAELPIKNLDFESWDEAKTRPAAWIIGEHHNKISADCADAKEAKCALQVTGDGKNGTWLAQYQPSSVFNVRRAKLSGWIRTKDLTNGFAALWMRVDAETKTGVEFDNMAKTAPTGTTPWQRFEISLPVAANTSRLYFGVLKTGDGTAWFDGLKLEVDEQSAQVPDAQLANSTAPTRAKTLMTDREMALAAEDIPAVPDEWRKDIRQRAQPIRSLVSDDFSDLQFLKPLLKDKRVVQLGESSHGTAEFSLMKVRLIKFLHQQMGFDVIAFESPLTNCDQANQDIGKLPPVEVMRECIFKIWHTEETLGLFDYLDSQRKKNRPLALAGFDIQTDGKMPFAPQRLQAMLELVAPARVPELTAAETTLTLLREREQKKLYPTSAPPERVQPTQEEITALINTYTSLGDELAKNQAKLHQHYAARPLEVDITIQEARSRVAYVKQLNPANTLPALYESRDLQMANNLDFLLDTVWPKRKMMVWAHNGHILKRFPVPEAPKLMGFWVNQRRKNEVYTIGLYMGAGSTVSSSGLPYNIMPPDANSLEAVMANAGNKISFVDFSLAKPGIGSDWIFKPARVRMADTVMSKLTPAESYDAILYIDTTNRPHFK